MPLSPKDLENKSYIRGIKCSHCKDLFTDEDRIRFTERQKYIDQLVENTSDITLWPNP